MQADAAPWWKQRISSIRYRATGGGARANDSKAGNIEPDTKPCIGKLLAQSTMPWANSRNLSLDIPEEFPDIPSKGDWKSTTGRTDHT